MSDTVYHYYLDSQSQLDGPVALAYSILTSCTVLFTVWVNGEVGRKYHQENPRFNFGDFGFGPSSFRDICFPASHF